MHDLTVTYEDGKTEDVTAGQRDLAEFELQPFGCSSFDAFATRPVVYVRYIAYAALKRQGRLSKRGMPYDAWGELVETVAFADTESAETPDPTKPGQ